jgi:hypothetical protein
MDEIVRCGQTWAILQTSPLEFVEIEKEKGTHGSLYLLHDTLRTLGFVSQSVPIVSFTFREKTGIWINYSSIYRQLRGEARKKTMKSHWKVQKFPRSELENFNNYLKGFSTLFFITKNPDIYKFTIPESVESQSSERTCPPENEPSD